MILHMDGIILHGEWDEDLALSVSGQYCNRILINSSDLQQTLSPIPSTSDLLEYRKMVKPNFEKYNRWCEEQFTKISLTGLPVRDVKINPQDVHGYAQIRHIKRNQRPMLSESAAEDLMKVINVGVFDDEVDNSNHKDLEDDADDYHRVMRTTLTQQQVARNLKVRSLDRQQQGSIVMSQRWVDKYCCLLVITLNLTTLCLFPSAAAF